MLEMKKKKALLKQAHTLRPVVMIGSKGFTAAVAAEVELALDTHELIKIKVGSSERAVRDSILQQIVGDHRAELLQHIGKVGIFYRAE